MLKYIFFSHFKQKIMPFYSYCSFIYMKFKNYLQVCEDGAQFLFLKFQNIYQDVLYRFTLSKHKDVYNEIFYLLLSIFFYYL